MSVIKAIKEIFSNKSVSVGDLNKAAISGKHVTGKVNYFDSIADIEITNEYRFVKHLIEAGFPIIFVSGKAGTGKSTLIRYLRGTINKNIVVVAPTGVAALNVKGSTIHSFFRFPPRIVMDSDIKEIKDRRVYTNLDLLIIDEISMVRTDALDGIDKFLRLNGKNPNLPFGGVQVIFIGDLFQLSPILKKREEELFYGLGYNSVYFFSAQSLEYVKMIPVELEKVYRQKDIDFTNVLNKIRVAKDLKNVLPIVNSRLKHQFLDKEKFMITLTTINDIADRINNTNLAQIKEESKTFIGEATGKFSLDGERLPSPLKLTLKKGAQIMFTKNGDRWVNGTVGEVVSFNDKTIQVQLMAEDTVITVVEVGIAKWETYGYEYDPKDNKIKPYVTGEYRQYPLMLAWAITIHKSQGKTLGKIVIDFGKGAFATGQVYVALSRTRRLSDIYLIREIKESDVKCDERIKRFYFAISELQNKFLRFITNPDEERLSLPKDKCPYCWSDLVSSNDMNVNFLSCSNPRCTYTRNNSITYSQG